MSQQYSKEFSCSFPVNVCTSSEKVRPVKENLVTGQYLPESAQRMKQAAEAVGAGISIAIVDEGIVFDKKGNLKVGIGFKGVRIYYSTHEKLTEFWGKDDELKLASTQ